MTIIVLKLDGEVWECSPGWGNDENSIGGVRPISKRSKDPIDRDALSRGITHRQTSYGGSVPCHEVRKMNI